MKKVSLFVGLLALAFTVNAQKVAKVQLTTTASVETILKACSQAGKEYKYGTKDLDLTKGTETVWQSVGNVGTVELDVFVIAQNQNGTTTVILKCPHVKGIIGSMENQLKRIVKELKDNKSITNLMVGDYTDSIE